MPASGKSSNRLSEQRRGYFTGTGHGIYAAQGKRDYESEQSRRHERGEKHNQPRCPLCK